MKTKTLLIGCGHHGEKYLNILLKQGEDLIVLETSKTRIKQLESKYKNVIFIEDYKLLINKYKSKISNAILCNWGPDHLKSINLCKDLEIKKIFVEKPLEVSIKKLDQIGNLNESNFQIYSNLPRDNSQIFRKLDNLNIKYNLGNLNYIIFQGGARDFSTTGIHYLKLASQIFGTLPISVSGNGDFERINPRGKNFEFWDGALIYNFSNNQKFHLIFSNKSNVAGNFIFNYDYGILKFNELGDGNLELIPQNNRNIVITRVQNGKILTVNNLFEDTTHLLNLQINKFFNSRFSKKQVKDLEQAINLTKALIYGIQSIKKDKTLKIDYDSKINYMIKTT